MSALNLVQCGRVGFEPRNLSRRAHRFDLQSEPLEFRQLLSTGGVGALAHPDPSGAIATGIGAAQAVSIARSASVARLSPSPAGTSEAVVNPVTAAQANLPTDNSPAANTPGVSPTVPAPSNVVTDDSASVTTSATALISYLNPYDTSPFTAASDALVYLVPMPGVPATTIQLSIATPDLEAPNSPVTLEDINSSVVFNANHPPVVFNANILPAGSPPSNNAPTSTSPTNPSTAATTQQATSVQHIGQSIQTELPRPSGPRPEPQPERDVVEQIETPELTPPAKTPAPKTPPPKDAMPPQDQTPAPRKDQAPPPQDESPVQWPPVLWPPEPVPGSQPPDGGAPPGAPGRSSTQTMRSSMNGHTDLSALFGLVAVGGGGYRLAMGESARFGVRWLPRRIASPRSARPRAASR